MRSTASLSTVPHVDGKKSESVKTNVKKTPIRKASLAKTKWTAAATTKAKRKNLNINGIARRTDMECKLTRAHVAMIRGFPHIAANPNSKVIFATAVGLVSFKNIT